MELSVAHMTRAFIVILSITIRPIYNAPRTPSAKYDQKQSGEVNVQVHLKDFNLIAVLGDNAWTGNGDYDYNYDYSDLTIKPSPSSATEVAQNSSEPSSTVEASTVSTTRSSNPSATIPVIVISENPQAISNGQKAKEEGEKDGKTTTSKVGTEESSKRPDPSATNVSIIPDNKEVNRNEPHLPLGEIMHYRKCSEGFTRDKHGRCRKVRRTPHLPFGIARFATNLATRFKQATIGNRETRVE